VTRARFSLAPDETVVATTHASFRGAAAASARSTFAIGSARVRRRAYEDWRNAVEATGFPTAGPEMTLVLTDRAVVVHGITFWGRRAATRGGTIELGRIGDVACVRHGLVTSLALALTNGQIVEVEAMRAKRLRRFARAVHTTLKSR
jgi:hypothetical protein